MPAFWFLDTLALQTLRYKNDLDEYSVGVLISWLSGEMILLRDRRYTREEFFREMKIIFTAACEKIREKKRLLHWEETMSEFHDAEEEAEDQLSSGDRSMKSLQEPSSRESVETSSSIDPYLVLDIVIDSTYNMYGNELRYDLIRAVFVQPIQVETRDSPFTLRTPRSVKLAGPGEMPFDARLQRSLRKIEAMEKSKKPEKSAKGRKSLQVPATPPPSLDDELTLTQKRRFILPLVEANEASDLLEKSND
ncbi:PREDICTED: uncharacterized protein LOC108577882 [Habropoda laboriosa]|nr:PREDICTED: uncharacterized protein LOC108577882 [Habropoda laboriosa]